MKSSLELPIVSGKIYAIHPDNGCVYKTVSCTCIHTGNLTNEEEMFPHMLLNMSLVACPAIIGTDNDGVEEWDVHKWVKPSECKDEVPATVEVLRFLEASSAQSLNADGWHVIGFLSEMNGWYLNETDNAPDLAELRKMLEKI